MRLAIIIWALYVACTDVYIYSYGHIEPMYSKLFWLAYSVCLIAYIGSRVYKGIGKEKVVVLACLFSLALNFILTFIYHVFGMLDYKWNFCTFNGIQLLTACFLLHSGKKRGLFINENK